MKWPELNPKYARRLWALHSAWALVSGIAVLVLAHNRGGFLRWAVLFIALTWASTLFFSRFAAEGESRLVRFAHGVVSYLTRVMYQETLFFLIPFYFYSATFRSWNFLYVLALAGFAVFSCFDQLFDRWLRDHRGFAVGFFAFVSFSALQLFLPLLLRTRIEWSVDLAAVISFGAAVALVLPWEEFRHRRRLVAIGLGLAAVLAATALLRPLLPPVPLRLKRVQFSGAIDPRTLATPRPSDSELPASELRSGRIYAVATIFSPEDVPARLQMRFVFRGKVLRVSRMLTLTAQPEGFRIWDSVLVPADVGSDPIRVEVWTAGQLLGQRQIRIVK